MFPFTIYQHEYLFLYRRTADGRLRQNRLYELHDGADPDNLLVNAGADEDAEDIKHHTGAFDPEDLAINTAYNYGYDALGNLVRDDREGITGIDWTVAGKVRSVAKATGPSLSFGYGAGGQRILKQVGDSANGGFREHYIRDAQGNLMAVYKYTNSGTASTKVVERPVYGSSRLGSYALAQEVMGTWLSTYPFTQLLSNPDKRYELNDHLGNVNTVVSGRLLDGAGAGSPKQAEVITASGYEPFGALLPGRNWRQPIGTPPPPVTAKGTLVITEFSNGPSGSCEYVELYVTKCALYPDATEVDIRGWIIDDNAGNFNTSGLCGTGVAINSGHLRFADVPAWASVPVGTVIVLFNGPDPADNCYGFTVDESGTGPYFIDVNSTSLLQRTGTGGTPSSTDCGYCDNSYTTATWDPVSLGNTADAIQVRCPDCPESEAGFFHGVAYGSGFGGLVAGANDLGGAYVPGPGGGRSYELTGTGSPGDGTQWTRITAPAGGTPPTTAGVVDAGVVAGLESASLACCGSFEAPVLAQKQGYRFGFNGMEKVDEMYGATGTSYDFGARILDTRVGRMLSLDPLSYKFPSSSNYELSGNNPVLLIDVDGKYKYPAAKEASYSKLYPRLTKYLASNVQNDVLKSNIIMSALYKYSGGNLTESEVINATTWRDGPFIKIVDNPGSESGGVASLMKGAFGFYDKQTHTIELSRSLVDRLEHSSPEDMEATLLGVYSTLLHETVHYGDYLKGEKKTTDREPGISFQEDVFESVEYMDNGKTKTTPGIDYPENVDGAKKIIDRKKATGKSEVLPTKPE